jgi:hypothetical protein
VGRRPHRLSSLRETPTRTRASKRAGGRSTRPYGALPFQSVPYRPIPRFSIPLLGLGVGWRRRFAIHVLKFLVQCQAVLGHLFVALA